MAKNATLEKLPQWKITKTVAAMQMSDYKTKMHQIRLWRRREGEEEMEGQEREDSGGKGVGCSTYTFLNVPLHRHYQSLS